MKKRRSDGMREQLRRMRLLPFLVTALYLPYMGLSFCGDVIWYLANETLYISPAVCLIVFWLGSPFKFCIWWKMQCFVPVIPMSAAVWQHFGGELDVVTALIVLMAFFVMTIYNAIEVSMNHERYSAKQEF